MTTPKIEWMAWCTGEYEIGFCHEKAAELRATGEWDKVRVDHRGKEIRLTKQEDGSWGSELRSYGKVFVGKYA